MELQSVGTVIAVKKQWWLKVNTKSFRTSALDGALFPHIVTVKYTVGEKEYVKRKWLWVNVTPPAVNDTVKVIYREDKPQKCRIEIL